MIYVIDHNDSFTHNVVHQLSLYDEVECDNYNNLSKTKLKKAKKVKPFLLKYLNTCIMRANKKLLLFVS